MFKRTKEMQSLINSSRKSLANAEIQIAERNKLIEITVEENREIKELVKEIKKLTTSNRYGRPDVILNKIKELIRDYQSETSSK